MALVPSTISAGALQQLKQWEGAIPYVYDDGDGTWPKRAITSFGTKGYPTIGVGHRIQPSEQDRFSPYLNGRPMPEAEILELLRLDVASHSHPLRNRIKVPITQSMWDALVLQSFNTGPNTKAIRGAIDRINANDWKGAQEALARGASTSKGKQVAGLVKRRAAEALMFLQESAETLPDIRQAAQSYRAALTGGGPNLARYRKRLKKIKTYKIILGAGAVLFASIAVAALAAYTRPIKAEGSN